MKLRAVAAPVNFRYRAAELAYLLENADAEVLVYRRGLGERVGRGARELPMLRLLVEIDDGSDAPRLDGAIEYEEFIGAHEPLPRVERSGDDFMLWYTGGTTGLPKGVVWHQEALLNAGLNMGCDVAGVAVPADLDELRAVVAELHASGRVPVALAATPLVHATAIYQANSALLLGGRVVMLERQPLDGDEVCEVIQRERITIFAVIGDVVAGRIVRALERAEAEGRPYDISSLRRIHNSGAMASGPVKDALLSRGTMTFYDALGSSEGTGYGAWLATAPGEGTTAKFRPGPHTKVLRADGTEAPNGEAGMLATVGPIAIAYYKDPERSAVGVPHHRRAPVLRERRLGTPRGRRHHHTARPGLGMHQHRRREGLAGRGGGDTQAAPAHRRRRGGRRARRELGRGSRRGGGGHRRPRARHHGDRRLGRRSARGLQAAASRGGRRRGPSHDGEQGRPRVGPERYSPRSWLCHLVRGGRGRARPARAVFS